MILEGLAKSAGILGELPPFQKPNRLNLGSQLVKKGGEVLGSRSQRKLKIGLETPHRRQPVSRLHPLPCELCRVRGKVRVKIETRTVGEKTWETAGIKRCFGQEKKT